jgi:hypothetical protein
VICELEAGAALSQAQEERWQVQRICKQFEVVYPDERLAPV